MKVAFFAHAADLTGANRSLIDLIVSLKKLGVTPVVFLPLTGPIEEELIAQQITYHIFPYKTWTYNFLRTKVTPKKKIKFALKELYNWLLALRVAKIVKKEGISLIHSNSMLIGFGGQVASITGISHVWHMRDFMEEDHNTKFTNERITINRVRKAAALIAISDVIARKFSNKFGRKVEIIYNGVDITKYSFPRKTIFNEPYSELLIAGRIVESKGQMEAVEAMAFLNEKYHNIHLQIIGDGIGDGELEKIQTYILEHHLENVVECIPFQTDMFSYYQSCDIILVCSHNEAFGRVTVEGMLAHSLVIGADAGCTPYLLKDNETGLLYISGDSYSLADKIEWAITHKNRSQEIANAGYDHGKLFSIDRTAEQVYQLYTEILGGL